MASSPAVPLETIQVAEESYRRCSQEAFFHAFYQRLLASDPAIPPKFANTDFQRQNKLLQHGIGLLLIYAKRENPSLLERIATRHRRSDIDVAPVLYPAFVDSLVATVRQFDPQATPVIEDAWRRALAPGIEYMIAQYQAPASGLDG